MRRSPIFLFFRRRAASAGGASLALCLAACAANSGATFQPPATNAGGTAVAASGGSTAASAGGGGGAGGFGATPTVSATGGTTSVPPTTSGGGSPSGGPDPTLFNWPEANPDGGTEQLCKPGHYVGTYQCELALPGAAADASTGFLVSGPVDLVLDESQDGEFLQVSGGTLQSTAMGIFVLAATVAGKLDCLSGQFEGSLQDGTVSIPPFPSGGSFTGPMAASFSQNGPELSGKWTLIGGPQFGGISCTGPWSATWQAN